MGERSMAHPDDSPQSAGTAPIVIRRSVLSTSFALIPGVMFLGIGSYIAIRPFPEGPGIKEGLICIVIGLVCLFLCLREMADRQPCIIMDDQGLRSLNMSMTNIPWHEMHGVKLIPSQHGEYLQIDVDDPDRYFHLRRGYTRIDRWMDRTFGMEGVSVGAWGLEMKSTDILALVRARIESAQSGAEQA
jgi:hypothetical protein